MSRALPGPFARNSRRGGAREGWTVVELLVVVTVIALLAALILPAVMSSRQAARKITCGNNLRQIALAMQQFEGVRGHYPRYYDPHYPHVDLLPFLEQEPLAKAISDGERFDPAPRVEVYLCPDDAVSATRRPRQWATSYGYSLGASIAGPEFGGPITFDGVKSKFIGDGLSHTAAFAEIVGPDPNDNFYRRLPHDVRDVTAPEAAAACLASDWEDLPIVVEVGSRGSGWASDISFNVGYNHLLPPNTRNCLLTVSSFGELGSTTDGASMNAAGSHPGLVQVAFLDGTVHRISDGIDLAVWRALGSVNGGEIVPDAF